MKRMFKLLRINENEMVIEKNLSHNHKCNKANILTKQAVSNFLKRKSQKHSCEMPSL